MPRFTPDKYCLHYLGTELHPMGNLANLVPLYKHQQAAFIPDTTSHHKHCLTLNVLFQTKHLPYTKQLGILNSTRSVLNQTSAVHQTAGHLNSARSVLNQTSAVHQTAGHLNSARSVLNQTSAVHQTAGHLNSARSVLNQTSAVHQTAGHLNSMESWITARAHYEVNHARTPGTVAMICRHLHLSFTTHTDATLQRHHQPEVSLCDRTSKSMNSHCHQNSIENKQPSHYLYTNQSQQLDPKFILLSKKH